MSGWFGMTLTPSPLRVVDRTAAVLLADPWRPLLALLVFYLLPYIAGYFLIYTPLIDGTHDFGPVAGTAYLVRYYGFIAWYFVLRAAAFCTVGRLIHDRLRGVETSFVTMARAAPGLWLRGLPVFVVFAGLAYLGQYAWTVPGILAAWVAGFVLPPFMLERKGLVSAATVAWATARGHRLISLVCVALLTGFGYGAQWVIGWVNGHFAGVASFTVTSVALNVALGVVQLIQTAGLLSLYACCRDLTRPPEKVAEAFE